MFETLPCGCGSGYRSALADQHVFIQSPTIKITIYSNPTVTLTSATDTPVSDLHALSTIKTLCYLHSFYN